MEFCSLCPWFHLINSLGPSDAIWHWRSWSTLIQVMACCLMAPSHYLRQCWLIISKVLWHSSEDIIIRSWYAALLAISGMVYDWFYYWLYLILVHLSDLLNIKYLKSRVSVNTPCTYVTITLDFHHEGSQSIPYPGSMRIFLIFSGLQESCSVGTSCFRTATIVLDLLI